MSKDIRAAFEAELARAVADQDFEMAAIFRDRIAAMREGRPTGSMLRPQIPGAMGLGTSQEAHVTSPRAVLPKRPDPMTKGHKPGGRRST